MKKRLNVPSAANPIRCICGLRAINRPVLIVSAGRRSIESRIALLRELGRPRHDPPPRPFHAVALALVNLSPRPDPLGRALDAGAVGSGNWEEVEMTVHLNRWNGKQFDRQSRCDVCQNLATVWEVPVDIGWIDNMGICKTCLCNAITEIDKALLEAAGGEKNDLYHNNL